jgi:uncharacterized protein (TIGR00270 family)
MTEFCDVCGKPLKKIRHAIIEGTEFVICDDCVSLGKEVHIHSKDVQKVDILGIEEQALLDDWNKRIAEKRKELGLTQNEFGKRIGESSSVVRRLENGTLTPNHALAQKIENVLKIELHKTK